jgi:2-iminoacetate synthase
VLTTREPQEFQDRALGLAGVISPGSPDVSPYRADGCARNSEESSQFIVADLRRPHQILHRIQSRGTAVRHFVDPTADEPAGVIPAGSHSA